VCAAERSAPRLSWLLSWLLSCAADIHLPAGDATGGASVTAATQAQQLAWSTAAATAQRQQRHMDKLSAQVLTGIQ
jgi:hypothetical protein